MDEIIPFLLDFPWEKAFSEIFPVGQFVLGIALYALFVFKFYHFLAKRDIFKIDYSRFTPDWKGTALKSLLFFFQIFEYLVLFPVFVMFWFGAIVALLVFLSKTHAIDSVMMIAISLVGAVRATAYYSEDLSKDLAKMLPFALLGVFIVDMTYFSLETAIETLYTIPTFWETVAYYCVFAVLLEFTLRILLWLKRLWFPVEEKPSEV